MLLDYVLVLVYSMTIPDARHHRTETTMNLLDALFAADRDLNNALALNEFEPCPEWLADCQHAMTAAINAIVASSDCTDPSLVAVRSFFA